MLVHCCWVQGQLLSTRTWLCCVPCPRCCGFFLLWQPKWLKPQEDSGRHWPKMMSRSWSPLQAWGQQKPPVQKQPTGQSRETSRPRSEYPHWMGSFPTSPELCGDPWSYTPSPTSLGFSSVCGARSRLCPAWFRTCLIAHRCSSCPWTTLRSVMLSGWGSSCSGPPCTGDRRETADLGEVLGLRPSPVQWGYLTKKVQQHVTHLLLFHLYKVQGGRSIHFLQFSKISKSTTLQVKVVKSKSHRSKN